ncbi:MAG: hypothetical protein ACLQDY_18710 [Streptosporangiaceae bacterium]
MREQDSKTRLDRPWHRPGAAWYALGRLPGLLHPPVSVDEPPADSLPVLRDVPVTVLVPDGMGGTRPGGFRPHSMAGGEMPGALDLFKHV